MSGHNITPRDRVWAAIFKQQGRFQIANVRARITSSERPNDETIRRVLRAGTELGVIDHQPDSPYYRVRARQMDDGEARPARGGRQSVYSLIDALNLEDDESYFDPKGADDLPLIPAERMDELIFEEGDEKIDIEDIISEVRTAQLAQSGQLDNQVIEEHVRTRVRTFEAEAGTFEWDAQVEKLVDEVVDMVEPSDPHQQSRIAEWIRSRAREEVNSDGT